MMALKVTYSCQANFCNIVNMADFLCRAFFLEGEKERAISFYTAVYGIYKS